MRRPPRPRRRWSFERLERRILLSGTPIVVTPGDLAGAQPLTGDTATGTIAPGQVDLFRISPTTDELLTAVVHATKAPTRLSLLDLDVQDNKVNLLVQSDGISPTNPDDLIAQHLAAGTYYLAVEGLAGASDFTLTAQLAEAPPVQSIQVQDPVGIHPVSSVSGDFNGDGALDLAVVDQGDPHTGQGQGISILLGNGDGTFQEAQRTSAAGVGPIAVTTGDFNGDGRPDLAVVDQGDPHTGQGQGVSILLGNGDGGFQLQPPIALGNSAQLNPVSITAGDFNGDGRPDLAVANRGSNDVSILLGNGDSTFQAPVLYDAGISPTSIVAGDFNRDGLSDLAIVRQDLNDVAVKLNLGGGLFADAGTIDLAAHNTPVVADLNGDGIPDVTIVDAAGDILFRQGRADRPGSFDPPIIVNPGAKSRAIASVLTSQGVLLASVDAANNPGGPGPGKISLFAYRNGRFTLVGSPPPTGPWPAQLVSADLNGDGWDDLIVRNSGAGTLTLYLSDGHGGFQLPSDGHGGFQDPIPVGLSTSDFAVFDVNQDGLPDLVATNHVTGEVEVLLNQGGGSFSPPLQYRAGSGPYGVIGGAGPAAISSQEGTAGVVAGVFTRGGPTDLATINPGSSTFAVLAGLGGGALANPASFFTTTPATVVRTGDFNGDGVSDLAVLGADGVSVYLGNGHDGFDRPTTYDTGPHPTGLTVADVNGDGIPDLLVGNTFGDVLVLLGDGQGGFAPYRTVDQQIALAVADLRGNGERDVIFSDQALDRVTVQYGVSGPRSVVGDRSQGLLAPSAVTVADLNGDGIPDLIVANSRRNDVRVYPGLGNGQFGPAHVSPVGTNPVGITVANLNGRPDLVVADKGSNDIAILLNEPQGNSITFTPGPRLKVGSGPVSTVVQDVNGDGILDLLVSNSQSNNVMLLPGLGSGFFNDQTPTIFSVGSDPGPLFVGNFMGRLGQLDLVTVNARSNDLTLIPDFLHGGPSRAIFSGGTHPVAALAGDFIGDGRTDLLVANNGDGRLALFLGGLDGLDLIEWMVNPAVPHPTALALDVLTGNLLQFFAGTEGVETATLLAFDMGGEGASGGGGVAVPVSPPVQQVARLQPLSESSLALIATLLSVTTDTTPGGSEATNATPAGAPNAVGALPNQPSPEVTVGDGTGDDADNVDQEEGVAAPVVPATAVLAPLARFVSGLDEAFEKVRLDARRGVTAPGPRVAIAAQAIRALDAALERWSPVITTLGGPAPALVDGLGRIVGAAVRAVDAALHALSEEGVRTPPPITAARADVTPATPPERDATPTLAAVASLGLMALTSALVYDHRHRSRTVPSPARPEARARLMGGLKRTRDKHGLDLMPRT